MITPTHIFMCVRTNHHHHLCQVLEAMYAEQKEAYTEAHAGPSKGPEIGPETEESESGAKHVWDFDGDMDDETREKHKEQDQRHRGRKREDTEEGEGGLRDMDDNRDRECGLGADARVVSSLYALLASGAKADEDNHESSTLMRSKLNDQTVDIGTSLLSALEVLMGCMWHPAHAGIWHSSRASTLTH